MTRPTIINDNIIEAFKKVVNEDINAIIMTDEELCLHVNELLDDKDKFSYSAFRDWKQFALENKTKTTDENMLKYKELGTVIKKALSVQKKNLFKKFRDEQHQWQRWAWIIERKFKEWNLKTIKLTANADVELSKEQEKEVQEAIKQI